LASIHSKFQDSTFTTSPKGMTLFPQPMRNTLPWSCLPFDHLGGQPPFVTAGFLCYLCTSPVVTPKPHCWLTITLLTFCHIPSTCCHCCLLLTPCSGVHFGSNHHTMLLFWYLIIIWKDT
jgi:hypothetical protein